MAYLASVYLSDSYFSLSVPFIRQVFVVAHVFFFLGGTRVGYLFAQGAHMLEGPPSTVGEMGPFFLFRGVSSIVGARRCTSMLPFVKKLMQYRVALSSYFA